MIKPWKFGILSFLLIRFLFWYGGCNILERTVASSASTALSLAFGFLAGLCYRDQYYEPKMKEIAKREISKLKIAVISESRKSFHNFIGPWVFNDDADQFHCVVRLEDTHGQEFSHIIRISNAHFSADYELILTACQRRLRK